MVNFLIVLFRVFLSDLFILELIPPPTVRGTKIFLAVLVTNFDKLLVPYKVATLSI